MKCIKCNSEVKEIGQWKGKCINCGKNYTLPEVYSRVVGYIRPISQWNDGKQSEFKDRKMFLTQETEVQQKLKQ